MDAIFTRTIDLLFVLFTAGLTASFAMLNQKIKNRMIEQDAIKNGMQAILRDRIIQAYNHYDKKSYLPIYAMENVTNMYEAYHHLGGNGTITELYEKMKKMPQREEVDRE